MKPSASGFKSFVAPRSSFSLNRSDMVYLAFEKIPPREFVHMDPEYDRAIIIPWLESAAVWHELRYCLRSIHMNFEDKECPIFIVGSSFPKWVERGGRVKHLFVANNSDKRAEMHELHLRATQIANEVAWWNDDIYLLRPTGWGDLRIALTEGEISHMEQELRASEMLFRQGIGDAVAEMLSLGRDTVMRFATHTPYLFEIEKSREILMNFHLHYKGSWETLYHNFHRSPHKPCGDLKTSSLPAAPEARFLNKNQNLSLELCEKIAEVFNTPAPWETLSL